MLIPLWLLWTVVALFVLVAVLRPVPPGAQTPQARERDLLRVWGCVLVVAVVAAAVTWDRVWVSEDELQEATQDAVALTQGGVRFDAEQVEVLLGDRLGRGVSIEPVEQTEEQDDSQVRLYAVQVRSGTGEAYDGAQACIESYEGETWYADVDQGACEDQ